jgi:holo-[acyl-carrier protein] synthase
MRMGMPNALASGMTAILGLGFDLIDLAHFSIHYADEDPDLLARCFTERELSDIGPGADRLARLAGRFAVKEATFKALGGGEGISHLDIETVSREDGLPQVRLAGAAQRLADDRGVTNLLVSISHSAASSGAVVIACAGPM